MALNSHLDYFGEVNMEKERNSSKKTQNNGHSCGPDSIRISEMVVIENGG